MINLTSILQNKHTTAAGLIYAAAKFGVPMVQAWFPGHEKAFDATAQTLEGFAVWYGLTAAGDAAKSVSKTEADTTFVKKTEPPKTP